MCGSLVIAGERYLVAHNIHIMKRFADGYIAVISHHLSKGHQMTKNKNSPPDMMQKVCTFASEEQLALERHAKVSQEQAGPHVHQEKRWGHTSVLRGRERS